MLFIFVISFLGCAHKDSAHPALVLPYAEELLKKVQLQGALEDNPKNTLSSTRKDLQKSPRRVYFRTLYHQYRVLGQILQKESEITFCPQFHHDKTEIQLYKKSMIEGLNFPPVVSEGHEYFPETAFVSQSSLPNYLESMRAELELLCEEGGSDNYFKFDNLITHYAHKSSFHQNHKAMSSVLKIPVFANFYLIKMINSSLSFTEERDFIKLSKTFWFESYVSEASRVRNVFIQNQMVKR
jgi:hypothetical protein